MIWQKVKDLDFDTAFGAFRGMDLDVVEVCAIAAVGSHYFDKIDRISDDTKDAHRYRPASEHPQRARCQVTEVRFWIHFRPTHSTHGRLSTYSPAPAAGRP